MSSTEDRFPLHIDRNHLPEPPWSFPDVEVDTFAVDSKPDFPPEKTAPEGSPNILLVLLDDVGYGWPSVNGGLVRMPVAERLAGDGLFYNQFHTTALCSPTRAAMLTGRNHHTVSTGVIQEMATGYPGYTGIIPKSCATFAELLKQAGYTCGWFGKNHNVPDNQTSSAGPFENWPTYQGFDYFYGFIGGETDQFYPSLIRNTTPIEAPYGPEDGYHLTSDLADETVRWIQEQKSIAPNRPFMAYFSTGAAHAPHQPPPDWRGRNKGRFDMGWDDYQRVTHARQLEMGTIPPGTQLTDRPDSIPAWDEFSEEEQDLFALQAETYADFLEHTDYEVGRIVDAVEALGELENTIVLYILGDNGSSAEGSLVGTPNELMNLNGIQPTTEEAMAFADHWGLPGTAPHYAVGWAWAGDAPFQWTKQVASHFGGTRNSMIISWPKTIANGGQIRSQFHHVIDIMPTLMEIVGIKEPVEVNGYAQQPIEGASMAYTFFDENSEAPSRRTSQYFEMLGHRAMYHDGWIASCLHGNLPWETAGSVSFDEDVWELYNIADDFSQAVDLADQEPERLQDLKDRFTAAAAQYNVLPLDDRFAERADITLRPSFFAGRNSVTFYPGMIRLPEGSAPKLVGIEHTITAPITIPAGGGEGVVVSLGGEAAGWSLFLWEGRARYHYNFFGIERYDAISADTLSEGDHLLRVEFIPDSPAPGVPATVNLYVDGELADQTRIERQVPFRCGTESLDIGMDCVSPVCNEYHHQGLFPFNGTIEKVTIEFPTPDHTSGMERLEMATKMD